MLNSKGYALDDFLQLMHKDKGFGEVPHHGLMLGPQNRWYSKVGMKDELTSFKVAILYMNPHCKSDAGVDSARDTSTTAASFDSGIS